MTKFSDIKKARDYANRTIKPMIIIMGDDGFFWVTSMRDGNKLIKNGYEAI